MEDQLTLEHDMDLGGGQLVCSKEGKFFLHSKEVEKNGGKKKKGSMQQRQPGLQEEDETSG